MAAYASTTTLYTLRPINLGEMLILAGETDLTNYNQTGAEETDITKYFRSLKTVICMGLSDNNYPVRWDDTDKCFHAFIDNDAGASDEAADNTDIGVIPWLAIGVQ